MISSYQQLSPDIAPLLPTPGRNLPTPSVNSIPTIPSNPSFQYHPDELDAQGPTGPAFPPMAMGSPDLPPASSASHHNCFPLLPPALLLFLSSIHILIS
ncbi:hypothetical protein LINPERPRIM_LOCUS42093 [Linum perenne]